MLEAQRDHFDALKKERKLAENRAREQMYSRNRDQARWSDIYSPKQVDTRDLEENGDGSVDARTLRKIKMSEGFFAKNGAFAMFQCGFQRDFEMNPTRRRLGSRTLERAGRHAPAEL